MLIELPKQLQNKNFKFILLNEKSKFPKEEAWQLLENEWEQQPNKTWKNKKTSELYKITKNQQQIEYTGEIHNYAWNDPKLQSHLINGGNYGVLAGPGDLRILDVDELGLAQEVHDGTKTFTIKTCGGLFHFYFISPYKDNTSVAKVGEYRAIGMYVVGPGCYAIDKKKGHEGTYDIRKDVHIQALSEDDMKKIVSKFLQPKISVTDNEQVEVKKEFLEKEVMPKLDEKIREMIGATPQIGQRSQHDERVITTLLLAGYGKYIKSIFQHYPVGEKYRQHTSPDNYLDHSIKNAREFSGVAQNLVGELDFDFKTTRPEVIRNKIDSYLLRVSKILNTTIQESFLANLHLVTGVKVHDLKKRLKEIMPKKEKDIVSFDKLMEKTFIEPEYHIEPLIPKGSLILIGAKPGKFKSMYVLMSLLSLTQEKPFMNNFTIKSKPKILLYDLENGEQTLFWRAKFAMNGMDIKPSDVKNLNAVYDFNKNDIQNELNTCMKYDIIVLDSYRRFLEGTENESDVTDKFFNEFLTPLRDVGKTIIIIHHFKKVKADDETTDEDIMDSFRGSSDIPAQFDIIWGMNKSFEMRNNLDELTFDVTLTKVKNRLGLPLKSFSFNVKKNDKNQATTLKFLGFNKTLSRTEKVNDRIVEIIQSKGNSYRKDIIDIITKEFKIKESMIDKHLKNLKEDGLISSDSYGKYTA